VLAGLPTEKVLAGMDAVFAAEQRGDALFVTVSEIEIAADQQSMRVHLCGHPPPLLLEPEVRWLDGCAPRPPIGLARDAPYTGTEVALPPGWALLQVTDGLFEGRGEDGERMGREGLLEAVRRIGPAEREPGDFLDRLIDDITDSHGGALPDDVAVVWIDTRRRGA